MDWSAYEVFAVIGGMVMLAVAAAPVLEPKERLIFALCGVLFAGYGFYVASQSYGTFTFPVLIYVVPIGAVARLALVWRQNRTDDPA